MSDQLELNDNIVAAVAHIGGIRSLRMLRHIEDREDETLVLRFPSSIDAPEDIAFESAVCEEYASVLHPGAIDAIGMCEQGTGSAFDKPIMASIAAAVADKVLHSPPRPTDLMLSQEPPDDLDGCIRSSMSFFLSNERHVPPNEDDPLFLLKRSVQRQSENIVDTQEREVVKMLLRLDTCEDDLLDALRSFDSRSLRVLSSAENSAAILKFKEFLESHQFPDVQVASHDVMAGQVIDLFKQFRGVVMTPGVIYEGEPRPDLHEDEDYDRWFIASETGGFRCLPRHLQVHGREYHKDTIRFPAICYGGPKIRNPEYKDIIAIASRRAL